MLKTVLLIIMFLALGFGSYLIFILMSVLYALGKIFFGPYNPDKDKNKK